MNGGRTGYSDQMARRIRCLKIASFDCMLRGGIFTEDEARAVLPYLEVRLPERGYRIVNARARFVSAGARQLRDDDLRPCDAAERVLRAHVAHRGYVYHRHEEDDIVVFWSISSRHGDAEIEDVLGSAGAELESRHRVILRFAIGGCRTSLVNANDALQEAQMALARGESSATTENASAHSPWLTLLDRNRADLSNLCTTEPIRSIQDYILENFRDPALALGPIATRFRLTETYLSQLFKEQTGVNYSVFLERMRVEEARRLLEDSTLSISDIASRVGYQINSTFYRAFRKIYGSSPTRYRRQTLRIESEARRRSAIAV